MKPLLPFYSLFEKSSAKWKHYICCKQEMQELKTEEYYARSRELFGVFAIQRR